MFQQKRRAYIEFRARHFYCKEQQHKRQQQQRQERQLHRFTRASNTTTTTTTAATVAVAAATTTTTTTTTTTKAGGDGTGINIYKFKLKMANTLSVMTNVLRNVVSKQRKRYTENGYNLDLAYITDNIIAMGYPAESLEGIYRNRLEDTYKFLEECHRGHYKLYNLCRERSYDKKKFHGRVAVYPFEDHNPPTIELIQKFCEDVSDWLNADSQNVAAVHCKAGKGRTGTMICCYLLYSEMFHKAEDALTCYDEKRTKDRKGVTIPSQRRYVQYFAELKESREPYEKIALQFCEIRFTEANLLQSQGTAHCSISVLNYADGAVEIEPLQQMCMDFRRNYTLDLTQYNLTVAGDIKVELTQKTSRKKIFHFWFNTYFVKRNAKKEDDTKLVYTLNKGEIDDAHKDKEHKNFPENFKVQLVFYAREAFSVGQSNVSSEINNYRKSQSSRLPQQSSSSSSSNNQLPQNSSSGSDLNYICDQKSSSSASVSSLGRLVGVERDSLVGECSDLMNRVRERSRYSCGSAISNNQSLSSSMAPVHERFQEKKLEYLDTNNSKINRNDTVFSGCKRNSGNDIYPLSAMYKLQTSTPNQNQQQQKQQNKSAMQDYLSERQPYQHQQQQQQQQNQHQQEHQLYPLAAGNLKAAINNRSSSNATSNGVSTKQKNSAFSTANNTTTTTHVADCNSSKSSKSNSISSHSSSATADNDEEEDWESANNHSQLGTTTTTSYTGKGNMLTHDHHNQHHHLYNAHLPHTNGKEEAPSTYDDQQQGSPIHDIHDQNNSSARNGHGNGHTINNECAHEDVPPATDVLRSCYQSNGLKSLVANGNGKSPRPRRETT